MTSVCSKTVVTSKYCVKDHTFFSYFQSKKSCPEILKIKTINLYHWNVEILLFQPMPDFLVSECRCVRPADNLWYCSLGIIHSIFKHVSPMAWNSLYQRDCLAREPKKLPATKPVLLLFLLFIFFFNMWVWVLGSNLGPHAYKEGFYWLSLFYSPNFPFYIGIALPLMACWEL